MKVNLNVDVMLWLWHLIKIIVGNSDDIWHWTKISFVSTRHLCYSLHKVETVYKVVRLVTKFVCI